MPVSAIQSKTILLRSGNTLLIAIGGAGIASLGPGPDAGAVWACGAQPVVIGPFGFDRRVNLSVEPGSSLTYSVRGQDGAELAEEAASYAPLDDVVSLTASGIVTAQAGALKRISILSGSCSIVLLDAAGSGTSGARTIATLSGLVAGDVVPWPDEGVEFVNGLTATITGTTTVRFEVQ